MSGPKDNRSEKLKKAINKNLWDEVLDKEVNRSCQSQKRATNNWSTDISMMTSKPETCRLNDFQNLVRLASVTVLPASLPVMMSNEKGKREDSVNQNQACADEGSFVDASNTNKPFSEDKVVPLEMNQLLDCVIQTETRLASLQNRISQCVSLPPCQYKAVGDGEVIEEVLVCDDKETIEYLQKMAAKIGVNVIDDKFDMHNFDFCYNKENEVVISVTNKVQNEVLEIVKLSIQLESVPGAVKDGLPIATIAKGSEEARAMLIQGLLKPLKTLPSEVVMANKRPNEVLESIKQAIHSETVTGTDKESLSSVAAVKEAEETRASLVQALMKPLKALPRLFITKDGVYMRRRIKVNKLTRDIRARMRRRAEQKRQDLMPDSSDEN